MPVLVDGIELRREGDRVVLVVDVNGTWRRVVDEAWKVYGDKWTLVLSTNQLLNAEEERRS